MAGGRAPGILCATRADPVDRGTSALVRHRAPGPVDQPVEAPDGAPGDGIVVVLTPLQLAAVLDGETVDTGGSTTERLWGGVAVIGGALELLGAGVLLLAPEPTLVSKAAGGVLGAHGLDTATAGLRQIVSGQPVSTLTADTATAAARRLGLDERQASMIGMGIDIAVPLIAGGLGAVRALAVRRGTISLVAHEASALRAGGHTLLEHVGQTEAQLRARLAAFPRLRAASTFRSVEEAERFVSGTLRANRQAIEAWAKTARAGRNSAPFVFDAGRSVGWGVVRASGAVERSSQVLVILRRVDEADRAYFILTAYPKL